MSEMMSVEHSQQYVGGSSGELHCKDCGINFDSAKSLGVHIRYHQENLMNQWSNPPQEESNNNNSKAGNHNSHVKRESVTAPADSSESSSRPSSTGAATSQHSQQQSQQQPPQGPGNPSVPAQGQQPPQGYGHFPTSMFTETPYFMQNDQAYLLQHQHHYSPPNDDSQAASNYPPRYHPYQHAQHYPAERTNSVSSSSPRSPPQCDKCGSVFDDANQLADHVRTSHPASPGGYPGQYQQMGTSPQQQQPQPSAGQMHSSPPQPSQPPQHPPNYEYNSVGVKTEPKDQEEQAEILDLDSHKVQTHRYEEELMRLHQQQEMQMQLHHQQQQALAQQRSASHSVSSMLGWPPAQAHDYHPGISPMVPIDSGSALPDQRQFMQTQHLPVEPARHAGSPIITSTQPMPGHHMPTGLLQQPPKPPSGNQSWKSNEARRPKTYNCTACNKWFTSSGHLKRHYNTTLHKNAVKQSNQPDPANMPISAHHHPGRDPVPGRGGPSRSPELSTSVSPPNLMAGPSVEASRGLLTTPTSHPYITSNSSNGSSNSNDSTTSLGGPHTQSLPQHQVQSPPQSQPTPVQHMPTSMVPHHSPVPSPMALHHHQQMGSPSPQLPQHHLPIGSPSQLHHHPMNSPMSPMHPPPPPQHLNSPSPMGTTHTMNSPSPIMPGVPPMLSPTMGGTTMPHQPYPNALPPHVTTTTSIPGLLESITSQLITTGEMANAIHFQSQDTLPGFGTFTNQRALPCFTQFGITGFLVGHNQPQAINVGGLSPEDVIPQEKSFESSASSYEAYNNSPPRYESLNNMDTSVQTDGMLMKPYDVLQHHNQQSMRDYRLMEANNNLPQRLGKEEVNPNIVKTEIDDTKSKEHQVTSTNTGSHYISQDGFHKCIECDKVFNKACYLTQHNKSFHSGDKPFKCNQCGKRFPHESLHAEHLQKHAGEKPYKCEICPKQFNHKTDLRRHMCLHTGEKPYACDTCGKGFIRKDHMMKHLDTHKKKTNSHNIHLRA